MNISESSGKKSTNILESYIFKNKQFIVMILGMPCTNKSQIAKELVIDLKLPILNINDYIINDKFIDLKVDGIKFKLYEHPDNYDWDRLNRDVSHLKSTGLILYGNYLDNSKINWKPDFSFFISMNMNICKTKLIKKKLLPYEEDDEKVKIYFTKIFNPLYDELKEKIKFNRFFNVKETTSFDQTYDELFDTLINLIKQRNNPHKKDFYKQTDKKDFYKQTDKKNTNVIVSNTETKTDTSDKNILSETLDINDFDNSNNSDNSDNSDISDILDISEISDTSDTN